MKGGGPPQFGPGSNLCELLEGNSRDVSEIRRNQGKDAGRDEREKSRRKGDHP
jgi:hypothetical protein